MTEPEIKRIEVSSGEEQKRPEEKKSKKGRFFIFLVLLATATFLFYKFNPLDPTIAIKDNINLLKEKKIDKAYKETSKDFKEETSLETFKKFIEQHPELTNNKSYSFDQKTEKENIFILKGTLISEDGEKIKIQYKITRENIKWKIYGIEILSP